MNSPSGNRPLWLGTLLALLLTLVPGAAAVTAAPAPLNAAPPGVLPALQQWEGGRGTVSLDRDARLVVPSGSSEKFVGLAREIARDAAELTPLRLRVTVGTPRRGDIGLALDPDADYGKAKPALRAESYRMTVADGRVRLVAGGEKGAYYASRTLLQSLLGSPGRQTLPVGTAVDWPDYAVRGFMLDVGRRYFTPEFIKSYLKWMGWMKMNTLQLHLNDNGFVGKDGDWSKVQAGFRLASDNPEFEGLAAKDGAYTRKDWDSFEDTAADSGVTLVPEIDAPAHALSFIRFKPELGLNNGNSDHLDLSKPESTEFMKSVYREFAPWFRGPAVHIGIDEYPREYEAQYRDYVNTIAPYVRGLGKKVNAWGSFAQMSGGGAGYDKDMTLNSWNNGWYGPKGAIADGYDVINSNDGLLYVVPFADYYHGQGLDGRWIHRNWAPNIFGGDQNLPAQDPKLLGAMPAVWNDLTEADYTEFDVHRLVEKSFGALAEKMWSPTAAGTDYRAFLDRLHTVGQGPGTGYLPDTLPKPDPADLAYGRDTAASSSETGGLGPDKAFDADPKSRWASKYTDDQWLQVDLGTARHLGSARLSWESAYAKDYDLQVSDNGTDWRTVAEQRGLTQAGTQTLDFDDVTARYVRMKGLTRGTSYGYSLYSFEVLAAGS
ncbi:family 20 glycosylhydrolase [Streptomyces sp. NA04227]|uniref:family 20 glycosylhydrolase n=1 Tax=Streptomyces sp. NA04227 TaxID=2742136 RepID=UPI0015914145|nr:family 20 glycosylhydrolase [Streptomyces sp. NA04227]QKW08077.1 family 20 glycosylhydrolase [Streptomyces sp. NA04227]